MHYEFKKAKLVMIKGKPAYKAARIKLGRDHINYMRNLMIIPIKY